MSAYIGLVGLLRNLRPTFGAVRSRDVEVRAQQKNIDAAIAMIEAIAAPLPQQAAGDGQLQLQDTPVAYAIFTDSGHVQIWFTKLEGAESWLHNNKNDPRKPEPIYRSRSG